MAKVQGVNNFCDVDYLAECDKIILDDTKKRGKYVKKNCSYVLPQGDRSLVD